MGRKSDLTRSIPPDTAEVDFEWSETSAVIQTGDPEEKEDRPTAVPPEPYESYAKRLTAGLMTSDEAKRALSAPSMPAFSIDEGTDEQRTSPTRDSMTDMEAPIPMLGQVQSGPHAIPLELTDDGAGPFPSDRPTTPQLEPPPEMRQLERSGVPTPRIEPMLDPAPWPDEAATPVATSPELYAAMRDRTPSSRDRAVLRRGSGPDPQPERSIPREDSLELSLSDMPPAPFEAPETRRLDEAERMAVARDANDPSMELSFDGLGGALDLVDARATPLIPEREDPLVDLRDRYAVGDFTGAHEIAESILADDPNNAEALRFRESCRDILTQMYSARLGSTSQIPRIAIPTEELQWLSLDHRAGFLLSCVDGRSSVEEILDVSGMAHLDALRILYTLLQQQIIEMVPSR